MNIRTYTVPAPASKGLAGRDIAIDEVTRRIYADLSVLRANDAVITNGGYAYHLGADSSWYGTGTLGQTLAVAVRSVAAHGPEIAVITR